MATTFRSGLRGLLAVLATLAALLAVAVLVPTPAGAQERDCSDFDTQEEAQDALGPADIERLDRDGDEIACEHLPSEVDDDSELSRTGFDVWPLALAGAMCVAVGLALGRRPSGS
jgi:hypothetical protein